MKNSIQIIAVFISLWIGNNLFGQNNGVTIGGSETSSDAVLWLIPSGNDGQQGLVLPETLRDGFTPTIAGMVIFDPSDQTIYLWDGSAWESLGAGGTGTADDWGTQTVVTDAILSGEGTTIDPLTLASQNAGLGQVLKWNGTSWAPALDETGETGASVNSINEITGDGTIANPLQLSNQGAVIGQILKWDGSAWTPADDLNGGTGATYTAGQGILIDTDNNIINLGDADADPANEIQTLSFDIATNELSLSDGNSISIPTGGTDADADPTNEIQTITFNSATNELSLSDGGTVTIPSGGTDADADPTNEFQDLTLSGTTLNISDGSGVDLAALIPPGGTDDQNLILTGDELSIEGGSGSVDLSAYGDDADADPSNEIQTLTFNAGTSQLSLTDGGTVTIPTGGTDADADPTNEIQTISYNGLTGALQLSNGGGTVSLPSGGDGAFESVGGVVKPSTANDDDFVFGSDQLDNDLGIAEDDSRMFFDKTQGAFRVGNSSNSVNWDESNRGSNSFGTGINTVASATGSVAMGESTVASALTSTAIGYNSNASGVDSFSGGSGSSAEGGQSFAFGSGSQATASRATALGNGTSALSINSTAMGNGTTASGENSTAMGFETEAIGENSTALGSSTTATGTSSLATGNTTNATGNYSFTAGSLNTASGDFSVAMGGLSTAAESSSFAMGAGVQALEDYSVAMGNLTVSNGLSSMAVGSNTTAEGAGSMAMNQFTTASGNASTAMGRGTKAESYASTAIGQHNIGGGTATSWQLNDRVFEVGIGLNGANPLNALTVLKNGRVGISENAPSTDLVVGSNFPFNSSATVPLLTVGGSERDGGAVVIGQEDKNFWLQSTDAGSVLLAREIGLPNNIGDFSISARTFRVGTTVSSNLFKMDVRQNSTFGFHLSRNDYGWEHSVNSINGDLMLYTDAMGGAIGCFEYASGIYTALSDRNSKEDVNAIGSILTKVNELEPLRYQFIGAKDNKKSLGFIAQDVKEIFPELVTFHEGKEGREGRHLMNYSGFGVVAIAAIQEQQEEIEDLKSIVEALMKRVERLEGK